ncbi:MAG: aldose epimerase [Pseudanabaenaceae cyanobacterium]|jgi:galactose mutarotase-like enzyme
MTLTIEQRQYQTYILTDDTTQNLIEVLPERGGIITRWQVGGRELFYLDTERMLDPSLSIRGGNPILFPICGNLVDNSYTHGGQTYQLKQHGFARELPWQVATDPELPNSITLYLESNATTKAGFPFDFKLTFTYELKDGALHIHQRYSNLSDVAMPFAAGFHPYFAVGDKSQLSFNIPGTQFADNITKTTLPYDGKFDLTQPEIDAAFAPLSAQAVTMTEATPAGSHTLTVSYDTQFTTFVFWTVQGKEFICLEPWTSGRNALNTGHNLLFVPPQSAVEMLVSFTSTTTTA